MEPATAVPDGAPLTNAAPPVIAGLVVDNIIGMERACSDALRAHAVYANGRSPQLQIIQAGEACFGAFRGGAAQCFLQSNGSILIAANARLDDPDDLARRLGIEERKHGHSELLAKAFERWSEECVEYLYGDWAFVAFDARTKRTVLARDPSANTPLFYALGPNGVRFATMPIGLVRLGATDGPNLQSLADLLLDRFSTSEASSASGIQTVQPGELVSIEGRTATRQWWWKPSLDVCRGHFEDDVESYRALLDQAVRSRLGARTASQLSSGWDSSAVTATAARLLGPGGGPLAYTAAPPLGFRSRLPRGRFADESEVAGQVAKRYGLLHHVVRKAPRTLDTVRRFTPLAHKPILSAPNLGWWNEIQKRAIAAEADVLLTGEQGNVSLNAGGLAALPDHLRSRGTLAWLRQARAAVRGGQARWRGVLINSFGHLLPDDLWRATHRSLGARPFVDETSFVRPEWRQRSFEVEPGLHRFSGTFAEDRLQLIRCFDMGSLRMAALAEGIHEHDPTADRRVLEWSLRLAPDRLLDQGQWRPLARAALSDRLPQSVLNLRARGLQGADWYCHVDAEDASDALDEIATSRSVQQLLDIGKMRQAVADWPTRDYNDDRVITTYRLGLLNALAVGIYIRWLETEVRSCQ